MRNIFRRLMRFTVLLILAAVTGALGFRVWQIYTETPDYLMERAQTALDEGNVDTAEILLQNVIQKNPNRVDARLLLADVYLAQAKNSGQPADEAVNPKALEQLREAAARRPDDLGLQKRLMSAFDRTGHTKTATDYANTMVRFGSNDSRALELAAIHALNSEDLEQAGKLIDRLVPDEEEAPIRLIPLLVRRYAKMGDTEQLSQVLGRTLRQLAEASGRGLSRFFDGNPEWLGRLLLAGVVSSDSSETVDRRLNHAVCVLENLTRSGASEKRVVAVAEQATHLLALVNKVYPLEAAAEAESREKRRWLLDRLAKRIQPAIGTDEASLAMHYHLAKVYAAGGDNSKALAVLQQGIAAGTDRPDTRPEELRQMQLSAAEQLMLSRNYADAQHYIDILIADKKTAAWGRVLAGVIALDEWRLDEAERELLQARAELGDAVVVRAALGNVRMKLERWPEALADLQSLEQQWDSLSDDESIRVKHFLGNRDRLRLAQAMAHLEMNNYEDALLILKPLELTPLAPDAIRLQVAHHWRHDRREKAWELIRDGRNKLPKEYQLLATEISMLHDEQKDEQALRLLEQFIKDNPDNLSAHLATARLQMAGGEPEAALMRLKDVAHRFPKEATPRVMLAQLLITLEKFDDAEPIIEHLHQDPATEAAAVLLTAQMALKQHGCDEAMEALSETSPDVQRSGVVSLWKGELAGMRGEYGEALSYLADSLQFAPLRDTTRFRILQAVGELAQQKSPAEAEASLAELIDRNPREPSLILAAAELAQRAGAFERALQWFDKLETLEPDNVEATYRKAVVLHGLNRLDEARIELERVLDAEPEHRKGRLRLASVCMDQGDTEAASKQLEVIQESSAAETQERGSVEEARLLQRLGHTDEAIAMLQSLIERQPETPNGYHALAAVYEQLGKRDEALAAVEQGLKQIPRNAALIAAKVELLCRSDKTEEADTMAQAAVGETPHREIILYFAKSFFRCNAYDIAREWAKRALPLSTPEQRPAVLMLLGDISLRQGTERDDREQMLEAASYYSVILDEQPDNFLAANNLVWLWAVELDEVPRAIQLAERIRHEVPDERLPVSIIDTLAVVYRKAEQFETAQQLVDEAIARVPDAPLLYLQSGLIAADLAADDPERRTQARRALETALELGLSADRAEEANKQLARLNTDSTEP